MEKERLVSELQAVKLRGLEALAIATSITVLDEETQSLEDVKRHLMTVLDMVNGEIRRAEKRKDDERV